MKTFECTEADLAQAEAMAELGPDDCCTKCGDGTEPGHQLCAAHEKERDQPAPLSARTDNWRASMGTGKRKSTRRAKPNRIADIIARGGVRCFTCHGHKTKLGDSSKPCLSCGGEGYTFHHRKVSK